MTPELPSSLKDDIFLVLQVAGGCVFLALSGASDFNNLQRKARGALEWLIGAAIIGIGLSKSLSRPWAFTGVLIVGVLYIVAVFVLWKRD